MTQTGSDTALLAITLVGRDGKRRYDSQSKLRLIEACLQPGVSVAGLALKAGVNANQLRRWIILHQQRSGAPVTADIVDDATTPVVPSACVTVHQAGRGERVERTRISTPASEPAGINPALRSRLTVEMPNGVTLRLDCTAGDASLVSAMIESLGRCTVQTRR
ncbi:transposase [Caballeronia sp. EK]|uniref:IS66-like element accessory protein TnpA n=1 Tax=Caballeronia sp. EK TaxID=2767469 RepID=UPI0016550CF4|nr:transposase [Caballeronia sp. EK]MBC8643041.1 transposase [Caballeronia sp. EK]